MDDSGKFWSNPGSWPDNAMGYVFLANAVNRVGKFLYPSDWQVTDNYPGELYSFWRMIGGTTWPLTPDEANRTQKVELHHLLVRHRPEFKRDPTVRRGPFGPEVQEFTWDEWNAALQEAARINKERTVKLHRRSTARRFIKKAILDGSLRYALLPKRGGAFTGPHDVAWWNVKDHDRIFYWCQLNPKNPTGIGIGGEAFQYVFVDEADLAAVIDPTLATGRSIGDTAFERTALIAAMETGAISSAQGALITDARNDGLQFWSENAVWPRDTADYLFLGRAFNFVGRSLYPDEWRQSENAEVFLPMFRRGAANTVKSGSFEEQYLESVVEAVAADHGERLDPFEAYFEYIEHERIASRRRIKGVVDLLIKAFSEGELTAFGQRIGGGSQFVEIPVLEWTRDEAEDWFMFCHQGPFAQSPTRLKRTYKTNDLPNFLFVERKSWNAFISRPHLALFMFEEKSPDPISSPSVVEPTLVVSQGNRPSRQSMREIISSAADFFGERKYLMWTKNEAEQEMRTLLSASRSACRAIFAEDAVLQYFPGEKGKRGPNNPNRNKELDEFRQFYRAAKMRK